MRGIAKLGVKITNVHAAGGIEMMQAAKLGLIEGTEDKQAIPELIAVTQLTSTSEKQNNERGSINHCTFNRKCHSLCAMSQKAGLDGVVSSASRSCEY